MATRKETKLPRMTVKEYLEFEEQSETKHEYHDGLVVEVLDMAGTSANHALVAANLIWALRSALGGKPCRVYLGDLKIWIHSRRRYLYPDASIICGKPTAPPEAGTHAADNPTVLIEVLSPSSAAFDRGAKFKLYKSLESLKEYVVVEQSEPSVDVYRRQPDGTWAVSEYSGLRAEVVLKSVGVKVKLKDLYSGVEFPEPRSK